MYTKTILYANWTTSIIAPRNEKVINIIDKVLYI